jgi:quinol monooxygenase YgiN
VTKQVDLIFRYRVKDGEQERFEQYLEKVLPVTESQEPYVLEYHIFRQEDGTFLQHERYADEAAIYRHMQVTAEGQADWAAAADLLDLMAVGELSQGFWDAFDSPVVSKYRRFREASRPYTTA